MTSGNLFSKLMREDCKRRTWAFALVFLAFFFILPIGLALAMRMRPIHSIMYITATGILYRTRPCRWLSTRKSFWN